MRILSSKAEISLPAFNRPALARVLLISGVVLQVFLIVVLLYSIVIGSPAVVLRITSDSMLPYLKVGELVLLKRIDYSHPEKIPHKVIAFYNPDKGDIIVHRVVQRDGECYVTKGDNAQSPDFFEPSSRYILGEVWLTF